MATSLVKGRGEGGVEREEVVQMELGTFDYLLAQTQPLHRQTNTTITCSF